MMQSEEEMDAKERASTRTASNKAPSAANVAAVGAVALVVASSVNVGVGPTSTTVMAPPATAAGGSGAVGMNSASPARGDARSDAREGKSDVPPPQRQWKRSISTELREQLVDGMLEELRRITGQDNERHLRMCASRYESLVWKKSNNETEYVQKLERRIQSLRRQPSQQEIQHTAAAHAASAAAAGPRHEIPSRASTDVHMESSSRSSSRSEGKRRHRHHRHRSSAHSGASSHLSSAERDELYFTRLRQMKTKYRDEVALVFRELCRVNTVIQHSASLRRHESNNLGDFLANLKKIIYLLEQQPDEMHGMIPQRKRTLEYLDVVESHIERKVLPILNRLRHTYSTILRPLVLNYLRNCTRSSRRL
ncbi:hypothetical protein Poli38472_003134 [Pythium oligandrum]|uniref:Mediator complex subunit 15 KIX domain-containing protein n=1 Tax=Pythium oligandrum TaxID=41045 RepID=A0A8K1FDS3_PYTOL|nr:hypothetical protein Poli38472_003134 [Pythium oligandrum]|eukprot:TMW57209.1 hypothetical protein Poli38472_003134 [Pythium oligandrum]